MSDDPDNPLSPSRKGRLRPHSGPKHIATRPLPLTLWDAPLSRICEVQFDPLYFGKGGENRFDAPRGEYGILYAADTAECAFVETCIWNHKPTGSRHLTTNFLEERKLTEVSFATSLRLVDLTGPGLALLKADSRLTTGSYRLSQSWAREFWRHPDSPDGILYRSRLNPSLYCVAVFDRAEAGAAWVDHGPLYDARHQDFLREMLDRYEIALL
ncbi:MAG TPA: RES family NAD+ phosphorylase [Thermoanaerobaculia bacterium]